jgi:hypothetical protein
MPLLIYLNTQATRIKSIVCAQLHDYDFSNYLIPWRDTNPGLLFLMRCQLRRAAIQDFKTLMWRIQPELNYDQTKGLKKYSVIIFSASCIYMFSKEGVCISLGLKQYILCTHVTLIRILIFEQTILSAARYFS